MPEVRGWNNMPVWAKILSAPVYADELAVKPLNSLMGLFKTGADMYGDYNASDAVAQLAKMGTPEAVNAYDPGFMPADKRLAVEKLKKDKINELYAAAPEATDFAKLLSNMAAEGNTFDPNFTGKEWVKGMATTPALGGTMSEESYDKQTGVLPTGKGMTTATGQNPFLAKLIQQGEQAAQEQGDTSRVATDLFANKNPDANTFTRFVTTGKGQLTSGEKGTGGASLVDKMLSVAKNTDDAKKAQGLQTFLNSVGNAGLGGDPKLNALYTAAQYGMKPEDIKVVSENTNITPTVTVHDIGSDGDKVQSVGIDSRGNLVKNYGVPTEKRSKTSVTVTPETPAQTATKMIGPKTIEDLSKNAVEMRKLANDNEMWSDFRDIIKGTKTGFGATTRTRAQEVYQGVFGKDPKGLTDAQLIEGMNTILASKATRQGDANPTAQQLANMKKALPGLSATQATNLYRANKALEYNQRQIREHNARVSSIKEWPDAGTVGKIASEQYLVADPTTARQDAARAELERRRARRGK